MLHQGQHRRTGLVSRTIARGRDAPACPHRPCFGARVVPPHWPSWSLSPGGGAAAAGPGSFCCGHGFHAGPQLPQGTALRGGAGRGAGPLGMKWGRSALRLTRSCRARGSLTLESSRRRLPSPWVVTRAARRSPTPRGPTGRSVGSGQYEPGGPAGRCGAGGCRGAAAGHPELLLGRRRGPGEPVMAGRPGGLRVAAGRPDRRPGSAG